MVRSIDPMRDTNWPALFLSALIPLTIAAGFVYLATLPECQPSTAWIYGMAFLIPIEFIRTLMHSFLGVPYQTTNGSHPYFQQSPKARCARLNSQ